MHLGFDRNEYGTLVSKHRCLACDCEFTVCPAILDETHETGCGLPPGHDPDRPDGCSSYDPARDFLKLVADGAEVIMVPSGTAQA